jgi:hypothetical protein
VGRWLGQLADIGVAVLERMTYIAGHRRSEGVAAFAVPEPGTGRVDLNLVWSLVARAMRWTSALRARLAAEAKAAKAALPARSRSSDRPDGDDGADWNENLLSLRRAAPGQKPEPESEDCILDKPTAEVVGQICADLDAAAMLMRGRLWAGQIAAIAAAARALLGGPDEAWTPLPVAGMPDRVADEAEVVPRQVAATPAPAPDTG